MQQDFYIPIHRLLHTATTNWTLVDLELTPEEIAANKIVQWCMENLFSKWTMYGVHQFAFENSDDAAFFKIKFGL